MATLLPWKLRSLDYSKPGWHTRPTVGFELMFEFLRLSPSYELARRAVEEGLTSEEKATLPTDFKQVLETYKLLGNVQATLFRSWWLNRGLKAFGNPHSRPKTHKVSLLANGADIGPADLLSALEKFLGETRRDEGLGPALVLSIPLGRRKSEVLKQVGQLLDQHAQVTADMAKPKIKLMGQRLRAKVLFNGIRLLWFKAAKPKWELWRLGSKARLSGTYSKVLNPEGPRKPMNAIEAYDRDMMTKVAHRALLRFEAIAENAARGHFPSDAPVEQAVWDYAALAKRIQRKNAWETAEKARLLQAFELQQARRAAATQKAKTIVS